MVKNTYWMLLGIVHRRTLGYRYNWVEIDLHN